VTIAITPPRLTTGEIVTGTLGVLGRRASQVGVLAVLLIVAPRVLALVAPAGSSGPLLAIGTGLLTTTFLGAVAALAHADILGESLGAEAALRVGVSRLGSLLLLLLLGSLAQIVALTLFVWPDFILFVCWMPSVAVCVVERRTSTGAALVYLAMAGGSAVSAVLAAVVMRDAAKTPLIGNAVAFILLDVALAVIFAVGAAGSAVVYAVLREAKEGLPRPHVAANFD
jgi:hypothetical protein